jgi:hypothetical protein
MRYTIVIPQLGAVRAGLHADLDLPHFAVLDVLRDMGTMNNAQRIHADGCEFTWAHYPHVIGELPLVFNPAANDRTLKNQLVRLVNDLRTADLIQTRRLAGRLFFRLTDRAAQLHRERTVTKSKTTITPARDALVMPPDANPVTPTPANPVTPAHDATSATILIDPGTSDSGTREQGTQDQNHLPSSFEEEEEAVVSLWNASPGVARVHQLTKARLKNLPVRLAEDYFRAHWQAGIERVAASPFCTGQGGRGWRANLDWFLRPDTLTQIIEGKYDGPATSRVPRPSSPAKFVGQASFTNEIGKL